MSNWVGKMCNFVIELEYAPVCVNPDNLIGGSVLEYSDIASPSPVTREPIHLLLEVSGAAISKRVEISDISSLIKLPSLVINSMQM